MDSESMSTLRPPDLDQPIEYACDPYGRRPPGRCRLRVWHEQRVALVTDLSDDHDGMSVTNAAEYIAQVVEGMLGEHYQLVEHYDASLSFPHRLACVHHKPGSPVATWSPLPPHLDWVTAAVVIG